MAALLVFVAALGGCGISVPLGGLTAEAPGVAGAGAGSASHALALPDPLPASLAASDAAQIGEAAGRALSPEKGDDADDGRWTNPTTGSTGTLVSLSAPRAATGEICGTFASIVTSIRGIHRYQSRACRAPDGQVRVVITEPGEPQQLERVAGI
jgi:hypothetical protein